MEKYARRVRYVIRAAECYHARAPPKRYHARITRAAELPPFSDKRYIRSHTGRDRHIYSLRILKPAASDPDEQVAPSAPDELLSG